VVDPAKILFLSSLIATQNLVAACHTMWLYKGGPKKLGTLEPFGMGHSKTARNTPLPDEFGRSRSNWGPKMKKAGVSGP